ncbi:hypothetical protein QL093DRAFT_2088869 [Fusarium oxysporum]|nr:hypothetical protein QL093DRAFT_2088869 [Fusarium oxysporum]
MPVTVPGPRSRRMPLSCEPCRQRKIKCPRNDSRGQTPCNTCVRRGIPVTECIYLRDQSSRRNVLVPRHGGDSALGARIDRLEELLRQSVSSAGSEPRKLHTELDLEPELEPEPEQAVDLLSPESTLHQSATTWSSTQSDASPTQPHSNSLLLRELGKRNSVLDNMSLLSNRYRGGVMKCLEADHYLWRHNLNTLQALVILIYGINHTHGQSWALLGAARNIALSLGCHVEPTIFQIEPISAEERRRCWAGLRMLYTIQNTTLGILDATPIPSTVNPPLDINDNELVVGYQIPESRNGPTQMSYLLLKFDLYDLCTRICSQLTLLLHRPVLRQGATGYSLEDWLSSQIKCIESSKELLGIHRVLHEDPSFYPYQWYNRGLGSFHAFHAAVCLAHICMSGKNLDPPTKTSFQKLVRDSLHVFRYFTETGISAICNKATPVMEKLLVIMNPQDTRDLSARRESTCHRSDSSYENDTELFDEYIENLAPQQWLSPSNMGWEGWATILEHGSMENVF